MAPGNSRAAVLHALTQHSICFSPISREKERGYFKAAFKYLHSKVTHAISTHISLDRASHMATWTWKRLGNGSLTWKGEPETLVSSTNGHHNAMSLQCPVINHYFFFFGSHQWHMEVPRPGIKPKPHKDNSRSLTARPENSNSYILKKKKCPVSLQLGTIKVNLFTASKLSPNFPCGLTDIVNSILIMKQSNLTKVHWL